MRNIAVFAAICLLGVSVAAAGLEMQDPAFATVHRATLGEIFTETTDAASQPWDGHVTYTDVVDQAAVSSGSCLPGYEQEAGTPRGGLDWYPDILVRGGSNFPGDVGRLSIDHAANGDLYVSVLNITGAPQDTVFTYYSSDGGDNWAPWINLANLSGDDTIMDAKIIVGPGANPWIYTFGHWTTSAGALFCRRIKHDGSGLSWFSIIRGDSIRGFDVDRNIETPMTMFLTYWQNPPDFDFLRLFASYDSGATWTNGRSVAVSTRIDRPSVSAGGDGYVYLAWADDSTSPWVGRYTNNLVAPTYVFNHPDSVAGDFVYQHTVCGARTSPGASQTAWLLNRHRHTNGNYDLHVSYTTNGGVDWTAEPWPPTNEAPRSEWNLRWPVLRYPYDYSIPLNSATATHGGAYDSLLFAYSRPSTPDVWEGRNVINDHDCTRAFPSALDVLNYTSGSSVIYRQYGSPSIWFDRWGAVGLAQEKPVPVTPSGLAVGVNPNPVSGRAAIRYSLAAPGEAELAVFDVTGRKLLVLSSGTMAAGNHTASWNTAATVPGVYLVRLTAGDRSCSERVIVAR